MVRCPACGRFVATYHHPDVDELLLDSHRVGKKGVWCPASGHPVKRPGRWRPCGRRR